MFDPYEIRQLMAEEIELITLMCRARKAKQAPQIHEEDFKTTLDLAAGQAPDEEQEAA